MEQDNKMVTVIIPTYKRSKYITRAIESVLNQTYQNFEIIVVDDNNPNTAERKELESLMNKYANNSKVIYIQHEKNRNGATARNTGIKIAKGKYITFLDDDDFYLKDRLGILVKALENNLTYEAAYSAGIILNSNIFEAKLSGNLQKEILNQKSFFGTGSNLFFRAKAIKELNGFDENFEKHQDFEMMVRFFRKYRILAVNEILVVKDNSIRINELNLKQLIDAREKFLKKFEKDINCYEDRNDIIQNNYVSLLFNTSKLKNNNEYHYLKNKSLEYGKMDAKLQLKVLIYGIFQYPIRKLKKIRFNVDFNEIGSEKVTEIKELIKKIKLKT